MKKFLNFYFYSLALKYPTPLNLNYNFNFGVLALLCLAIQILSGIFLVMFYTPNVDLAFDSIIRLMTEIEYGWFIRYLHANVASFFFIVVYLHIGRGFFYGSYKNPRGLLWYTGIIILFLLILTAFLGYTLPWGQMSFWGATVITNFASVVPLVGVDILQWIWGGFAVGNSTLGKFFSLHYLLPFILLAVVIIHLYRLHQTGSSNPIGVNYHVDKGFFGPYYILKDSFTVFLFLGFLIIVIGYLPNTLGHTDNWIKANPLSTPTHIVPEWYFLLFYAILRAIPNKTLGVVALILAIISLLFVVLKTNYNGLKIENFNLLTLAFFSMVLLLTYIGSQSLVNIINTNFCNASIAFYFIFLFYKNIKSFFRLNAYPFLTGIFKETVISLIIITILYFCYDYQTKFLTLILPVNPLEINLMHFVCIWILLAFFVLFRWLIIFIFNQMEKIYVNFFVFPILTWLLKEGFEKPFLKYMKPYVFNFWFYLLSYSNFARSFFRYLINDDKGLKFVLPYLVLPSILFLAYLFIPGVTWKINIAITLMIGFHGLNLELYGIFFNSFINNNPQSEFAMSFQKFLNFKNSTNIDNPIKRYYWKRATDHLLGPSGFGQLSRGTVYVGFASTGGYFINDYLNRRHELIIQNNQFTQDNDQTRAKHAHEASEARTSRAFELYKQERETWVANGRQGVEPKWNEPKWNEPTK